MKKEKYEKAILEELNKFPNITSACNKVGLSRQSFYRWTGFDPKFKAKVEKALLSGVNSINDLAESKLVGQIKRDDLKAIRFWLSHNKSNYMHPRPTNNFFESLLDPDKKITGIKVEIINRKEELEKKEGS